ncbi:MAG: PH domain-containing protein [Patescibacteria group bacterium]|mgnify:CR=1 FL=1
MKKYLNDNEKLIHQAKIGDRYYYISLFLFFPFSIILIGLPHLLKIVRMRGEKLYLITDQRVMVKSGIFSTTLTSAPHHMISHISVRENFLHRLIFNVGDVVIHTAGPTPIEIILEKISDPMAIKNIIEEQINRQRTAKINENDSIIKKI